MITIWHNPRCSKSRQTLALIAHLDPVVRLYLADPPSADEVRAVQAKLGLPLIQMTRTGEKVFKEIGLTKSSAEPELLSALVQHPVLIERPIVITQTKAAIGRPPETVLALLD